MDNATLLKNLYDTSPLMIGIITINDNDFKYLKVNKVSLNFLGECHENEIVNHWASELGIPQVVIDKWVYNCKKAEETNAPAFFEYDRNTPTGLFHLKANTTYLGVGMDGTTKYYAYIAEDITEKKNADAENIRLLNDLNTILDATTEVCITSADLSGTITHFNKGAEKLLGYTAEEVVGKYSVKLFHTEHEVAEREKAAEAYKGNDIERHKIFVANKTESKEFTYVRKDGSTFPVQLVVTPKIDHNGKLVGYQGVAVWANASK